MKKPLRCWLTFHDWRMMVNDEGQRYKPVHVAVPTTSTHARVWRDRRGRDRLLQDQRIAKFLVELTPRSRRACSSRTPDMHERSLRPVAPGGNIRRSTPPITQQHNHWLPTDVLKHLSKAPAMTTDPSQDWSPSLTGPNDEWPILADLNPDDEEWPLQPNIDPLHRLSRRNCDTNRTCR
jgi:hypothetical protein